MKAPPPPPPPSPPADATGAPASTPPPAHAKVTGLSCPKCGGSLAVEPGLRALRCPFCDTGLLALGDLGVRRLAVEPEVPEARARGTVESWWKKGLRKDPRLKTSARTAEAFLCFLPFFRFQADVVGYALGTEKHSEGSGDDRRTVIKPVERRVEQHHDATYPAVNTAEWGVARVDLRGDRLVPFDPEGMARRGMVFAPTLSEEAARRTFRTWATSQSNPASGLHEVDFEYQALLRERLSVIYYPLWVVRYRFRERSYQAVIDAEDGRLAYGKAPGNDLYRAVAGIAAAAGACYVPTTLLQFLFNSSAGDNLGLLVVAGSIALALLTWGWRQFRHGGEIEEGDYREPAAAKVSGTDLARRFTGIALPGAPGVAGGSGPGAPGGRR